MNKQNEETNTKVMYITNYDITQNKYSIEEHKKNVTTVVRSPYREIVDCILGMDDIGKKYQCILDLVNSELFVRDALPDEDARWYYCKSCGVPGVCLLPTFFYELAHSYNPQDPKSSKYIVDLSYGCAKKLDFIKTGVIPVTLEIVDTVKIIKN